MRGKNVLYLGGFELPDKNAAAHRVLSNGKILKEIGHKVFFMGISNDKECEEEVLKTQAFKNYGVDYKVKYPKSKREWIRYLSNISDIVSIIELNAIGVVIAYNYPALALFKLSSYCKKNKIQLLSDCTEWYVAEGTVFFRIVKGLDTFFRMRVIHPRLDGLIVISKYLYNYYSKKNKNTLLVPPLVDLEEAKWKQNSRRENSVFRFIYAGSPDGKTKDHLGKIISAFLGVQKEFHFSILGITEEEYNEIWKETPIPFSRKENITFYGRVSNSEVIKWLKESDFSIFIREDNLITKAGFPTKFVEAISAGTPVLSNKCSNIEDYLTEGVNGFFVDISDVDALTSSLNWVLNCSRDKVAEMKLNCINYNKFNYLEYKNEFKNLLDYTDKSPSSNKKTVTRMKYLAVLILFLFFSFKFVNQDPTFVYKTTPKEYVSRGKSLSGKNLVTKEMLNASYSLVRSFPLNYDKTGKTDYTDIIQSVLDKYSIVTFPNFPLLIDTKGLILKSDSKIIFEKGSKLILKANDNENYEILRLREVHNVSLYSPNIVGDRQKHFGKSGEWGFGISIKGSQNIKIYKAEIRNCWGDGIYLGSYNVLVNTNILIKDCFLDNNRRNGISIISGINITIDNALISNTNGTLPMSGIDVEPNTNSEFLENININNTTTFNNGMTGILIVPRTLQGKDYKKISINIKNHIDDASNYAMGFVFIDGQNNFGKIEGNINVVHSVWKNSKVDLVNFREYADNGVKLNFSKTQILHKDARFSKGKIMELKEKCKEDSKFTYAE